MSHRTYRVPRAAESEIIVNRWLDDEEGVYISLDPQSPVGEGGALGEGRASTALGNSVLASERGNH